MMRFFTSDLRRNITKIVCLTLGLSIGMLLVAKIWFMQTNDSYFKDLDRIYRVTESMEQQGEFKEFYQTPGAIAPGLKQYVPQVEAATRYTPYSYDLDMLIDGDRRFEISVDMVDTCFFDVFPTPILEGNPHEALAVKFSCMIPRSLAEKIGGDVMGKTFTLPSDNPDVEYTINGVYEDFPLNCTLKNRIYLSLVTISRPKYDSMTNWVGNDRYKTYVRLAKGTDLDDTRDNIQRMLEDNVDKETMESTHYSMWFHPMKEYVAEEDGVADMLYVLAILSVLLLMSSGLNYLLIVIGQMGRRGKEMAVRKCYGTSDFRIFSRVIGESLFFLVVSALLGLFLVSCFSDLCRRLLDYTPRELMSTPGIWIAESVICLILLIITGAIPAWMYCRTPVAAAFRGDVRSRRGWKLALLFVQFFATGLLICLLTLIGRQYYNMANMDLGVDYENVATAGMYGIPRSERAAVAAEIASIPGVTGVALTTDDILRHASGNNIWTEGRMEDQYNVGDLYFVSPETFGLLGIDFVRGGNFREDADTLSGQVIVDERMIDVLVNKFGVRDEDVVGTHIFVSEHSGSYGYEDFEIVGVINELKRGAGFENAHSDTRAAIMFPARSVGAYLSQLYVRYDNLTPELISKTQSVMDSHRANPDTYVRPYGSILSEKLSGVRNLGTAVTIIGIIILLIAVMGLIGYCSDEVQRRAREIAIRKVTGTPASGIVRLFCIDIVRIALPALLLGGMVAVVLGRKWLTGFSEQVSLAPWTFVLSVVIVLIILLATVVLNSFRVAKSNPVNHLRSE